jgi:hypothetical protein
MNAYVKQFLHRGLLFGGFGPIATGVVYAILDACLTDFSLGGKEVLVAIVSTYLLAFVHAGTSVFHQIESWPLGRVIFWHVLTLYVAYLGCYILNSWIPFEGVVVAIFTAIFAAVYLVVWLVVYLAIRGTEKRLNAKIGE